MTRTQWAIIGGLALTVLAVFCILTVLAFYMIQRPVAENEGAIAVAPNAPGAGKATATPIPTWPPTYTPTPFVTATRVVQETLPTPTWIIRRPTISPATPRPTNTRVPGPIQDAWDKTATAHAQRFEMNMTLAGDIWNLPGATGSKIEFSFMNFKGEFQGRDSHFVLKGYAVDYLIPSDKGIEMINLGDQIYLRGPVPLLGAPEAKWYVEKVSALDRSRPVARPTDWMGYGYGNANWSGLKKSTPETLDGQRCDVYRGDKTATLVLYQSRNPAYVPGEDSFADFDAAESKVWVCGDGYVHQFLLSITTHSKYDPKQKGTLRLQMRFYDINGNIKITAPANATPLNLPKSNDNTL